MKPNSILLALGLLVSCGPLVACGGEDTGTDIESTPTEAIQSLSLSGDVEVPQNASVAITATAQYPDGTTRDVTRDAALSWIVEDVDVAVVDAEGMVKGLNAGATRVHAAYGDTVSEPQNVVVK